MNKILIWLATSILLTSCGEDAYRKTSKQVGKTAAIYASEALNASKEENEKRKEKDVKERRLKLWEKHCKNEKGEIIENKIFATGKEEPIFCSEGI